MLKEKLEQIKEPVLPEVTGDIPHGDMPGDKIRIEETHIQKASTIFPVLLEKLKETGKDKAVVSVFGGSGVGKSEIASLLAYYLRANGIGAYVLSGDNYPRRIPMYNDAERLSVFRSNALRGLVDSGEYSEEVRKTLFDLWEKEKDPDPKLKEEYPWLAPYQEAGRKALKGYLGTDLEQNYEEVSEILKAFKEGQEKIYLKRMGRKEEERWYDLVDFSNIDVLIVEWTHGGNAKLQGIDVPVLLNSTPEETREHRRLRARDGKTDSDFTTMVLEIEQEELMERAKYAKIILSKSGDFLSPEDF
ncbi:MAG: hypothetical protein IIZ33_04435 [Erysipelotrichaceae bacterium]|nr:hypothetical protein [Erysipelotrichaceae bacterium]